MSQRILTHLSQVDPVLGGVIRAVGPRRLQPQGDWHPFQTLARAIAHQQLNGTAANTILRRLIDSCGQGEFPTPHMVLAASPESLRAAGFSYAKVAALRDLAEKTLAGVVPDAAALRQLSDAQIIERLTQVRGIGRWTVEMLLIFQLGRPDVLPVDDFGVQAGFRAAYALARMPRPKAIAAWGERWRPYRSTAAWYLWRALELKRLGTLPPPVQRIRLPRVKTRLKKARRSARRGARKTISAGTSSARPLRLDGRSRARPRRAPRSRVPASKR